MSILLEALKKAQRDQQQKSAPSTANASEELGAENQLDKQQANLEPTNSQPEAEPLTLEPEATLMPAAKHIELELENELEDEPLRQQQNPPLPAAAQKLAWNVGGALSRPKMAAFNKLHALGLILMFFLSILIFFYLLNKKTDNSFLKPIQLPLAPAAVGQAAFNKAATDIDYQLEIIAASKFDIANAAKPVASTANNKTSHKNRQAKRQTPTPAKRAKQKKPPQPRRQSTTWAAPIHTQVNKTIYDYLQAGYAAYQANNLQLANYNYQRALHINSNNKDAQLGIAAILMRRQDYDRALVWYKKILHHHPNDSIAYAQIIAAKSELNKGAAITNLERAIGMEPRSAPLYFALANKYATTHNWQRAQAAYFKAYSLASDNAEYAFNLAVSLDHLGKKAAALNYYQRAAKLLPLQGATINQDALQLRIHQLSDEKKQ